MPTSRAKKATKADGVSTPQVDTVRDTALSVDAYRLPDGGSNSSRKPTREGREGDTQALPTLGKQDVILEVVDDLDSFLNYRGETKVLEPLVLKILSRRRLGIERYGHPLETHNGRNARIDAFEELLDLQNYLKQAAMETPFPAPGFGALQNLYRVMMCYVVDLAEMLDKEGLL